MFLKFGPCLDEVKLISPSENDPAVGISIIPGTPNEFTEFENSLAFTE